MRVYYISDVMLISGCLCLFFTFSVVALKRDIPEFVPTHEWQVIQPGQAIPMGIHVRSNLQTGLTEGKLLDSVESPAYAAVAIEPQNNQVDPDLYQANNKKLNVTFGSNVNFRPYDELKKDYQTIQSVVKTESDVLSGLFKAYQAAKTDESACDLLEDITDLVRKIDNAVDFAKNGNLTNIILELLDASSKRKICILRCISGAMQGNPQVKVIMLQNNLLQYLSQIWDQELRAASSVNSEFLAQCVLATSSLLRHFPLAQNRFFSPANGEVPVGFHLLNRTMVSPHISRCTSESCSKLKLRIFALLEDLLLEAAEVDPITEADKHKQYEEISLDHSVRKYGLCQWTILGLRDPSLTNSNSDRQRVLSAAYQLMRACSPDEIFPNVSERRSVLQQLLRWKAEWKNEAIVEEDGLGYFSELADLAQRTYDALS